MRTHVRNKHLQVLLGPYRGQLFTDYIKEKYPTLKPSAFVRDLIYEFLAAKIDKELYDQAFSFDEENKKISIENRLEGRALSKLINNIRKNDLPPIKNSE